MQNELCDGFFFVGEWGYTLGCDVVPQKIEGTLAELTVKGIDHQAIFEETQSAVGCAIFWSPYPCWPHEYHSYRQKQIPVIDRQRLSIVEMPGLHFSSQVESRGTQTS